MNPNDPMLRPSDDHPEWGALPRYFAGELSEAEAIRLQAWLDADPGRAAAAAEFRAVWEVAGMSSHTWDAAAALRRINQIKGESPQPMPSGVRLSMLDGAPFRSRPWWRTGLAAAAAVATIAIAGHWGVRQYTRAPQVRTADAPMTELVTRRGQRADLLLPDGSRVTLGVSSRLRYPAHFDGASRDLYLDGEAYFQVAHDPTKPLRVYTVRGVTQDIGTAFGVRAYGADEMEVIVTEGAVVLRSIGRRAGERDSVVLTPADLGRMDAEGRVSRTSNVDTDAYLAWRQGKLVFHDVPLREVLRRLSLWYDVDLELADGALADRPFTASFDNESVDQVLDVLAVTMQLRYERRGSLRLVFAR